MPVLRPEEIQAVDVDQKAMQVFLKVLEMIGGPRKLIEFRNLTWLPSLMTAAYTVVLSEEMNKTEDEIAQFLGISRNAVRMIKRADPEKVRQKVEGELAVEGTTLKDHIAGGLAKLAYQQLKRGDVGPAGPP